MTRRIHRLTFTLVFPAGLAPGEAASSNLLTLARDGRDRPVLRGSALAGVLRSAWAEDFAESEADTNDFFGTTASEGTQTAVRSRLEVPDCVLDCGGEPVDERTFHLRDRHLGSVADAGLFGLEVCPPKTKANVTFWLDDTDDAPDVSLEFLRQIVGLLRHGLCFGGQAARGIGLAELDGRAVCRSYDLSDLDQHAAWLDDHRRWRDEGAVEGGEPLRPADVSADTLRVSFDLTVPRGQDVLVGDGQGLKHESEPQRVTAADGNDYWRLPGSSLRGLFRAWVARLAAREGKPVSDSYKRHAERFEKGEPLKGDDLGYCFEPEDPEAHDRCPVARLFGSLHKAGRIHIADGYAPTSDNSDDPEEAQNRIHVAVDQVSGGAVEHMLFDNQVLTAPVTFPVTMRVEDPTEDEAGWLAATIRALDVGLLRVGSAKSAGRLSLRASPEATGPYAELFIDLCPHLTEEESE